MLLDLSITFNTESGDTVKYVFGTTYYSEKNKKHMTVDKAHSEILEIKSKIAALIETLL